MMLGFRKLYTCALIEKIPLTTWVFDNWPGIIAFSLATISVVILWSIWNTNYTNTMRFLAGFRVTMILFITTWKHFPSIILLKGGGTLSLLEEYGNEKTIEALGYALLIGSVFVLPTLIYLIYSFQKKPTAE